MFLPPILIPACHPSSPAFLMMCSVYRLNKRGDSRLPCRTPFSILNQSVGSIQGSNCYFLTHIQVRWSGIPFSLRMFQFVVICTVRGFPIVNEAEVDVFLEFSCFLHDTVNVGNLAFGSSAFSKPSLYIWKFLVYILLKPSLKDFEHNLTSM